MRNRIATTTVNGHQKKLFIHESCPGLFLSAVHVTFETPQHARQSIRKVSSHKWLLLHGKPVSDKRDRRKLFGLLDRTQYRAAIGL